MEALIDIALGKLLPSLDLEGVGSGGVDGESEYKLLHRVSVFFIYIKISLRALFIGARS